MGELSEIINDSESVRQKAVKKNGNNTSDKGLEKMHNHFKMKMVWKEKGIKEVDYQNVIRKKKMLLVFLINGKSESFSLRFHSQRFLNVVSISCHFLPSMLTA